MRFRQLQGRTSLPIAAIRRSFRNEDVRTVLLVTSGAGQRESLLVATTSALAIVTGSTEPDGSQPMTRWAPWEVVIVSEGSSAHAPPEPEDAPFRLSIAVGGLTFFAEASGEEGRRALRDFVVAAQERGEKVAEHR